MTHCVIDLEFLPPQSLPADFAQVIVGTSGAPGAGLQINGLLPDVAALPASASPGDAYLIAGALHIWIDGMFVNAGPVQGPPGPPGHPGQIRFTGFGAPPLVIIGAEPGDTYLDLATGDVFKLS